ALFFLITQPQQQRLRGAGLVPDVTRRMGFGQRKAGAGCRFRRIENFCFVMGGDFFWTHKTYFVLGALYFFLCTSGCDKSKVQSTKHKVQSTYLSLGITSLPLRNKFRTSRS